MSDDTLILIPARMASTRLPGKPLADINGRAMILHVLDRARESNIGAPVIATDSDEIAAAVKADGGQVVLTRADHPSGSDRIFEALEKIDPHGKVKFVINVQGDLPTIDPTLIGNSLAPLIAGPADIATLITEIRTAEERTNPSVVKAVVTAAGDVHPVAKNPAQVMRALYFTRATAPYGDGPLFHHIGLYAYRREALARFVRLPPSPLEEREKLEQLRALENGMRIDCVVVDTAPLGVDTPDQLEIARAVLT